MRLRGERVRLLLETSDGSKQAAMESAEGFGADPPEVQRLDFKGGSALVWRRGG